MYPAAAGSHFDLTYLYQQVQELSSILAQNRESTVGLRGLADEIRKNRSVVSEETNGVGNGDSHGSLVRQHELEEENSRLRQENTELRAENEDLSVLVQDYEAVLDKVLEGLRMYAHEHSVATINIHSSYTNQLANERATNAAIRQEQAESEARLAKISALLREAYSQDTALEPDIVIEGLKVENRALRAALGIDQEDEGGESGV